MIFALLTLLAALAVAGVAGWFSIVGIMSIYAGAPLHAALVMGVVLEGAKLVTTSWLYRNWEFSSWKIKGPLIYFTVALMIATSIGVFGFLTKSHLEQGAATVDNSAKIERIEQQIVREKSVVTDNEKVIGQLDTAINSYLGKDNADRALAVRRAQAPQRKQLRSDIDASQKKIDGFSEEKLKLTSQIRALQLEVGPIRYIAELFYGTDGNETTKVEAAVKMFTLLIVSTLDPLAIILLIAANHTLLRRQNEKKEKSIQARQGNTINDGPPPIEGVDIQIIPTVNTGPADGEKLNSSIAEPHESNSASVGSEVPQIEEIIDGQDDKTGEKEEAKAVEPSISNITDTDNSQEVENSISDRKMVDTQENKEDKTPVDVPLPEIHVPEFEYKIVEDIVAVPKSAIISPSLSRINFDIPIVEDVVETPEIATIESAVNVNTDTTTVNGWGYQESILRELHGSQPHFVAKKLIEQPSQPPVDHDIILDAGEMAVPIENTEIVVTPEPTKINKLPKTLSWLKEFKGN